MLSMLIFIIKLKKETQTFLYSFFLIFVFPYLEHISLINILINLVALLSFLFKYFFKITKIPLKDSLI